MECKKCGKLVNAEAFISHVVRPLECAGAKGEGEKAKIRNLLFNQRPQTMEAEYAKLNTGETFNELDLSTLLGKPREGKCKVANRHGKNLSLNAGTNGNYKTSMGVKEELVSKKDGCMRPRCRCESFDIDNPIAKSLNNFVRNTPVVRRKNLQMLKTDSEFSYTLKEFKSEKKKV